MSHRDIQATSTNTGTMPILPCFPVQKVVHLHLKVVKLVIFWPSLGPAGALRAPVRHKSCYISDIFATFATLRVFSPNNGYRDLEKVAILAIL